MATSEVNMDVGGPKLNLTPEEKRVYGQLFQQADSGNIGVVTGDVAVKFFEKTKLNSRVLGEIWQIADKENRGFLTPSGFGIVLRLIGHAQAGREPTPDLAQSPGPLPRFDGISIPPPPPMQSRPPPAPSPTPTLAAILAQGPGNLTIQIPALTPEKATQYAHLFERQTLQNGNMLPGDAAKSIFEKSGLPNEVLGRIWQLADTEQRGSLVQTEFVLSMHLLTCMKTGTLRTLPSILPAALYEAATQRIPKSSSPGPGIPPVPPIPKQLSGTAQHQTQMRTGSPLARQPIAPPPVAPQPTGMPLRMTPQTTGMPGTDWLVTPQDKTRFDQFYDTIDTTHRGFITGEEAVNFFGQSNLPDEVLAQVWDLADINGTGNLTRDTFAVAMYLIRQQRMHGTNALPSTLPPSLIPPSMRASRGTIASISAFDVPSSPQQATATQPLPQPKSALDDLFGLTTSPHTTTAPTQTAMETGGSSASKDPFTAGSPLAPGSPVAPVTSQSTGFASSLKPFVPTSSFGLSLAPHKTGESTGSAPAQLQVPGTVEEDLLGDTDPEISKKLTNETAELANMSNQIGTLGKQIQDLQNKRNSTQLELSQASTQKKQLEGKLAHLRTMYENEAREVRALEQQLNTNKADTKKLQAEYAILETTAADLQNTKNAVLTGLQNDQQENLSLKEKIKLTNAEIAAIKPQIEKLKLDARQQKGRVSIHKKQLSTSEGERDKLKAEAEDLAKSNEEVSRQLSGTTSPAPTNVQVASPAGSSAGGNNPFFRRTASTDVVGAFASSHTKPGDDMFSNIFGPMVATSNMSTPPPTSFKKSDTSTSSPYATPGSGSPQLTRQTPATTNEPPPPPESQQLTPNALPMREHVESISSSRQVSPPASRMDLADLSSPGDTGAFRPMSASGPTSPSQSEQEKDTPKQSQSVPFSFDMSKTGPSEQMFGGPSAEDAVKQVNTTSNVDPFGSMNNVAAKDAFDNAFASMGASKAEGKLGTSAFDSAFADFKSKPSGDKVGDGLTSKSVDAFNAEFPPISQLEQDDDSDSDNEKGGFDDNFETGSPKNGKGKEKANISGSSGAPAPESGSEDTPKSDTSTVKTFPPVSTAPPQISVPASTSPAIDNVFASSSNPPEAAVATNQGSSSNLEKKPATPFDELDDFEGLEDAKEGSADDDFANISRSGLDDFNPVFDSSPPPSQAKSESTAFGAESSFDFANVSEGSSGQMAHAHSHQIHSQPKPQSQPAAVPPPSTSTKPPMSPDNQEWEALFAGLDTPTSEGAATTKAAASDSTTPKVTDLATDPSTGPEQPLAPGKVLAEDGQHDSPALNQLLDMGYERNKALRALEECNYDASRAVDVLLAKNF